MQVVLPKNIQCGIDTETFYNSYGIDIVDHDINSCGIIGELPEGWTIKPVNSYWSYVLNEDGDVVFKIFCKDEFYDEDYFARPA